jgi:hypothetical protein
MLLPDVAVIVLKQFNTSFGLCVISMVIVSAPSAVVCNCVKIAVAGDRGAGTTTRFDYQVHFRL